MMDRGYRIFTIDIGNCPTMDSTFLGVLAGFGQKISRPPNGQPNGRSIELLNPNTRISELLPALVWERTVGVLPWQHVVVFRKKS